MPDPQTVAFLLCLFVGVALIAIATGIVVVQQRAKSCPRHSRYAGGLAWIVAAASAAGGIALALLALFGL